MTRIAMAIAVVLLAGCTQAHWSKTGAASSQVEADTAACRRDAGQDGIITVYQNDYAMMEAEAHFRECMKGRGYTDRID